MRLDAMQGGASNSSLVDSYLGLWRFPRVSVLDKIHFRDDQRDGSTQALYSPISPKVDHRDSSIACRLAL